MSDTNETKQSYKCLKCSNTSYTSGQMLVTGGFWSKVFDVQNRRLITISCEKCGYTELFKGQTGLGENIFDFLAG